MTAKLNDYAGAADWRWQAIDVAKEELLAALHHLELLSRRLARTSTREQAKTVGKHVRSAIARLGGS